ncbi:MAG: glycosyltransferase [Candidatus Curtissbacteria bacterium]
MKSKVTCIIPFYNENLQLIKELQILLKVRNIDQIICIDDGSTNNTAHWIKQKSLPVTLVKFKTNKGKAQAVAAGLKKQKTVPFFLWMPIWKT